VTAPIDDPARVGPQLFFPVFTANPLIRCVTFFEEHFGQETFLVSCSDIIMVTLKLLPHPWHL
jgi:hypothetical protein